MKTEERTSKNLSARVIHKGVGRKFPGGGEQRTQDRKIVKRPKNSTIMPLPGRGQRKKDRKIALFSLYVLNMYHI